MIIQIQKYLLKQLKKRKMKTTIYNLQKAIITAILVLAISTVGSAATKSDETSTTKNSNMTEATTVNHEVSSTAGVSAEMATESTKRNLSTQIEDWMSDGSYWEADNAAELSIKDLASEIESWMSNGSYWSTSNHTHNTVEHLTGKIKSWMTSGSYWGTDKN